MKIKLSDGFETTIYKWEAKNPKGIMQIVHGSAEHASRYEHFAKWLNKQGISVWAIDLRGHGEMEQKRDNLGYFGKAGKERVIEDINEITLRMKNKYKDLPYTLLGHSMGSFIVRMVALKYSNIDNLVVVGTNHQPRLISFGGHAISKMSNIFLSSKKQAKLLDKLSYKQFDKKLKNAEPGEWISANKANRKSFAKDPLSGFTFTRNGFDTMSYWVNTINSKRLINKQDKTKRVLFIAGKEDPVGNMSKEVVKANSAFNKVGIKSQITLFPNMRHEVLNETKKLDVYKRVFEFINKA